MKSSCSNYSRSWSACLFFTKTTCIMGLVNWAKLNSIEPGWKTGSIQLHFSISTISSLLLYAIWWLSGLRISSISFRWPHTVFSGSCKSDLVERDSFQSLETLSMRPDFQGKKKDTFFIFFRNMVFALGCSLNSGKRSLTNDACLKTCQWNSYPCLERCAFLNWQVGL